MRFMKFGQESESNIFNQLDEKKKELAARGVDVINLSIGTPDFQPDKHVMQAVSAAALDPNNYKYSINDTDALVGAVQNWYDRRYGVKLDADQIMTVDGSQEGIAHVAFPFITEGDLVLAPDPGYPIFTLARAWRAQKSACTRSMRKRAGSSTLPIFRMKSPTAPS